MNFSNAPVQIAIVGGGASGSLLAIQLLRQTRQPLHVLLIERTGEFGRGVAYGTRCPDHLLNVPAGRMSALPNEPEHFLRWLEARAGQPGFPAQADAGAFVPRHLFGTYLQELLAGTAADEPGSVLERVHGEVVDVDDSGPRLTLRFADGSTRTVDQLALAIGNLPGEYPIPRPLPVYKDSRYVHIPWQGDALAGLRDDDDILLVGHGLTATDLIVQLHNRGHRGTIHALSRRGIRPQVHRLDVAPWPFPTPESIAPTIRAWTRAVREQIRLATAQGQDWRAVIDGLRPHTQTIWQRFSDAERARFMRHVRPLWDAHRHRVPEATAAVVDQMAAAGRLKFYAGRLQVLEADEQGLHALVRHRRSIRHESLRVAKVINCTGARTDYTKYQHPLLIHLLARGLIGHDPLALGINALPTGEVIRYRGQPQPRITTLGAPLKGVLWESTAIREIRQQAQTLASNLLAKCSQISVA